MFILFSAFTATFAALVKVIQMLIQAYAPALDESLGTFIPLIVVNCIIMGRAEAFAYSNTVLDSFFDGAGMGLGFTPPDHEDGLRCHYDAGNYQIAVEGIIWRTYEQTLPADAVELNIAGHRAAQYWIMKPTDWNDRWWVTCMITFKTSYGLINQSLFYSPIESPDRPDCLQTNLQRANQLVPFYKF